MGGGNTPWDTAWPLLACDARRYDFSRYFQVSQVGISEIGMLHGLKYLKYIILLYV